MKNFKLYLIAIGCLFCSSLYAQNNSIKEVEFKPYWSFTDAVGWGFLDGEGSPTTFRFTLGANYFFKENIYAGAQIGYLGASNHYSEGYKSIESKNHFITIPLELGYTLVTENRKWGIAPFAGLGVNIGIKGKTETEDYGDIDHEIGGKLGLSGRIGVHIILSDFIISGSYNAPLNSKQEDLFGEDAYPEVTIGYAFSLE